MFGSKIRRPELWRLGMLAVALTGWTLAAKTGCAAGEAVITGQAADAQGKPLHGVMISAFDSVEDKSTSVFTGNDGKFKLPPLPRRDYKLRARLLGLEDGTVDLAEDKLGEPQKFTMKPAEDLNAQRPSVDRINHVKFDNPQDRFTFRMTCGYCHQVGSEGFRAPEQLVDWKVMLTEVMAGPDGQQAFKTLPAHIKANLPDKLFNTFSEEAYSKWDQWTPPPAPEGEALDAIITEWPMGIENIAMMHDLEIGRDGLAYTIDSANDALLTVDPKSGKRQVYPIPGGKPFGADVPPIKAPHSIEEAPNGDMWVTLCYGKEMARFRPSTKEWLLIPSGPDGHYGMYPHTLRFDQKGICWYTDAATNSVFRLDPESLKISQYKLLQAGQAINAPGDKGGQGVVPYGMSIAPDGMVWYTKLNMHRVGRINPATGEITEWKPPVVGPRRLEVAPNGIVWIPGCGSGDFCKFNPKTNEWKVYPLPGDGNEFPYALSVHPKTGDVWICGAESDTIMRFHPDTEKLTVYRMPSKVTYTRELEFTPDGAIWTCNSNLPARHIEGRRGAIIRIEVPMDKKS